MSSGADLPRVAVLGTGIMGSAMARNLLSAGLATTVWDRSASATASLAKAGAEVAGSSRAAGAADVVITMLPTAEDSMPLLRALSREWRDAVDGGRGREDVSATYAVLVTSHS